MPSLILTLNAPGSWVVEDDGIFGNNRSQLRAPDGTLTPFVHPGASDRLDIVVSVPGVTVDLRLVDSLASGVVAVGSLSVSARTPDDIVIRNLRASGTVLLVAKESITEGGADSAADIVAGTLLIEAGTGIGTATNALETQTRRLEAETSTGGIALKNSGALTIGGVSGAVSGLSAGAGNVTFSNVGSITLADTTGPAIVSAGAGNISLTALGADADITATVNKTAVSSQRSITLTAGRDIALGTVGTNFANDVVARDNLTASAGRDIILDGAAKLAISGFNGRGDLTVNAGRNISLPGTKGSLAGISMLRDGEILISTGVGGTFTQQGLAGPGVRTDFGNITLEADRMVISGSGISSGGSVTLRPASQGRDVNLGSTADGDEALELSAAELALLAGKPFIGSAAAGRLIVTAPVALDTSFETTLLAGTDILILAGGNLIAAGALELRAGGSLGLGSGATIEAQSFEAFLDQSQPDGEGANFRVGNQIESDSFRINGSEDPDQLTADPLFTGEAILQGFGGDDTLTAGGGRDFLDGGTGADRMTGGPGDNGYNVDDPGDRVIEASATGGRDTIFSTISLTLGPNVEALVFTGTANLNGTGNGLDNLLVGNSGANRLIGGGGVDELNGQGGDDRLEGGPGNDTYFIDSAGDRVVEVSGGGTDLVNSEISFTLGTSVDDLTLTGPQFETPPAIDGTGNGLNNVITGNSAANVLRGLNGSDMLAGGGGTDTLDGGAGRDRLTGGTNDADNFRFSSALNPNSNVDAIQDFVSADDTIQVSSAIFSGLAVGALPGSAFRAGTAAADSNDRIVYDSASGRIFFDSDGTGPSAAILFATVAPLTALTAGDFVVFSG